MNLSQAVKQTIELLRQGNLELAKSTFDAPSSSTTGFQLYNLEQAVRTLVPRTTPLRNSMPRVGGQFATQANWKAVTAIDSGNSPIGVPEGTRNAAISVTLSEYNAVFKTLSVEGSASFQAQLAAKGFDDLRGRARNSAAHKYALGEERLILGGNTTNTGIALGTPSTPAGTVDTDGGSISVAAQYCYVVALTYDGWKASSVAGGVATQTAVSPADGSASYNVSRGSSQKSSEGSVTGMTGSTNAVVWTCDAIRGAVAYAWYIGATTGAANCKLADITTVNTYTRTTNAPTTTQAATAVTADNSQDAYVFDGLITQISKSGSNGYWLSLDGAALTADTKGGIEEFDTLLVDRFVTYQVHDFEIVLSAKMAEKVGKKIRTGSTATPFAVNVIDGQANIVGGGRAIGYTHPITGALLPLVVHPEMPDGTIIFKLKSIEFEDDNIPNVWQLLFRQDIMSVEWAPRTFKYEVALIADGVLQGYFPAGNGVLCNVALS